MSVTIRFQTTQAGLDSAWTSTPAQAIERRSVAPLALAGAGAKAGFVDPVTAVLTLSLATLGFRLFEYLRKKDERGIQIDLRTTPATVTDLANVPHGFVVIIDRDGKAKTERADYDKPEQMTELLAKLLGASP